MITTVYIFLLLFICVVVSSRSMPGGWTTIDEPNNDGQVVPEAEWAARQIIPNGDIAIKVVSAERQVVAGLKFRLTVEVDVPGRSNCTTYDFLVYDRFGAKFLANFTKLADECTQ